MKLPEAFIDRIQTQFPDEYSDLLESISKPSKTFIRTNKRKNQQNYDLLKAIPWSNSGYELPSRPNFTLDPQFHAGAYYVQEASSMFLDFCLESIKSSYPLDIVLDMCAAPGGKSTLLLDHLKEDQFLIANEIIENRNVILRENLIKWGFPNFAVTQNDAKQLGKLTAFFDLILVDAPCSGEGMFRKDADAIQHWSESNLEICSKRQMNILHDIWPSLKDGGIMIYSTCTFNPMENECLLNEFAQNMDFETISLEIPAQWNIRKVTKGTIVGYQFLPHKVDGEGFFCSILKKVQGQSKKYHLTANKSKLVANKLLIPTHREYYTELIHNNGLFMVNKSLYELLPVLQKNSYIKQVGIEIGRMIKDTMIEEHGLAMLFHLDTSVYNQIELTKYQALQYLSKEVFDLENTINGVYLVVFEGLPLGFLKQIGQRFNNYYPKNWRILMNWKSSSELINC